jgi:hypothetical protein
MMSAALLLSVAYVITTALLLLMNLATPYSGRIKGGAIILVSGLYAVSWFGYQGITGWPSSQRMPEVFEVLWISIDERRIQEDVPSSIYYWVRNMDEAGLPEGQPRAFRRPWSERAAEDAEQAIAALENGEALNGTLSRTLMTSEETSASISNYAGENAITGESEGSIQIRFTTPPARRLPPKQPPN